MGQTPVRLPDLKSIHNSQAPVRMPEMRIEKGQTGTMTSLAASLCNPRQAWPGCFVLQIARTLLVRSWGRSWGRSWRRSRLAVLLLSGCCRGGFGGGCLDGGLNGFQFLHRFVARIHGALTMTVEVFFGTFQLRFGPFQRIDGWAVTVAWAASESWRRSWTHVRRRSLPGGRLARRTVLGAQTVQG